jgi:hypothetical protein
VRLISVKGRATELGQLGVNLHSYSPDQDNSRNDSLDRSLNIRYGLDASVSVGNFIVGPNRWNSKAASRLVQWSAAHRECGDGSRVAGGAAPHADSSSRTPRAHARSSMLSICAVSTTYPPLSSYQSSSYYVIGDVAGSYQVRATLTMAGDRRSHQQTP